ncbi:MAG: hypothetical protein ABSG20_28260, partial [Bradyrhizobium sp.]
MIRFTALKGDAIGACAAMALGLAIAGGVSKANAQVREVTIAHQDMVIPFRVSQAAGAVEKATGYKI